MDDLISRQDIYEKLIYDTTKTISLGCGTEYVVMWRIADAINEAPAVDAVPVVHGRWERAFNLKPSCSVCGEYHLYSWSDHKNCNFCPNCGATIDGGNDG